MAPALAGGFIPARSNGSTCPPISYPIHATVPHKIGPASDNSASGTGLSPPAAQAVPQKRRPDTVTGVKVHPGVRSAVWIAAVVAAVVTIPLLLLRQRASEVRAWADTECQDAMENAASATLGVRPIWGFLGEPISCEMRRAEGHLFGDFSGSGYYVITTDEGLFVTRIDYATPGRRGGLVRTVPLDPADLPDGLLTTAETTRYRHDYAGRDEMAKQPQETDTPSGG